VKLTAIAASAALALGAGVLIGGAAGTPQAEAQNAASGFTLSVQQLVINQRISSAAVRRVNEALKRLDDLEPRVKALEARVGATPPAAVAGQPGAKGEQGSSGPQGPKGDQGVQGPPGLSDPLTDGPYPGQTQLADALQGERADGRENSAGLWTNSAAIQTSWVKCGTGRVAISGGFGSEGGTPVDLNVTWSSPAVIDENDVVVSETNGALVGVDVPNGDYAFRPNAWLVKGFYHGTNPIVVRPFVTCATVND
jgi:hypothetical protein